MNVENYIKEESLQLKNSRRVVEIAPDIDEKHLAAVKKKYKGRVDEDFHKYVLVMSYTGTGVFFMTGDTFYFDNFMQGGLKSIKFREIRSVETEGGGLFSADKVYLSTEKERLVLDGCIDGLNLEVLGLVFSHIISKARDSASNFTISEQGTLSSELPEELKLLYLKILCNYAYINDAVIDANEYNAITKFSVRMEMQGETRGKLRIYMNNFEKREKTGNLLAEIKEKTENQTGYWDVIKYCLMQDALYIHEIQSPGKSWREDGFIGSLMEHCSLNPDQIESMRKAVSLNKKMQKRDANMEKLKSEWKAFIKSVKGTRGYVPTPYLFCSGSVYGLKSYTGFLKRNETSQKAVNKQRELILQEIIANNQKAVNVLVGDMNYLAERLEKALQNEQKIQQDYDKVKQLLSRIKAAMSSVRQEEECRNSMPVEEEEQGAF